jgi:hypothetical protein
VGNAVKHFCEKRDFSKLLFAFLAVCAGLPFFAVRVAAASPDFQAGVRLEGDAAIYGLEGEFAGDVYADVSVIGYTAASGRLIVEGLISKMSSYPEYVKEYAGGSGAISLRFPASLINQLPGGVHDLIVSSWDYQGRSEVVVSPVKAGRLFIKTAVPDARIDYVSERLANIRGNDGIPGRPETRRQAYYAVGIGNAATIVAPDFRGSCDIPEEWMTGEVASIVHLNEMEELSSEPQAIAIPSRPDAPQVFALDETSRGASDGMVVGVTEAMEYSDDGGIYWTGCSRWKIEGLAPGEGYRVRFKAVEGASFASKQVKIAIKAAPADSEALAK